VHHAADDQTLGKNVLLEGTKQINGHEMQQFHTSCWVFHPNGIFLKPLILTMRSQNSGMMMDVHGFSMWMC